MLSQITYLLNINPGNPKHHQITTTDRSCFNKFIVLAQFHYSRRNKIILYLLIITHIRATQTKLHHLVIGGKENNKQKEIIHIIIVFKL